MEKNEKFAPLDYRAPTKSHRRFGSFNVRELLTVIAVLAVIITAGSIFVDRMSRTSSMVVCESNLHVIGMEISKYEQDNRGQHLYAGAMEL